MKNTELSEAILLKMLSKLTAVR